jgi:hypothetical protein
MYPLDHAINSQDTKIRTVTAALRRKSTVLIMAAVAEAPLVVGAREGTIWTETKNVPATATVIVIANEACETVNETGRGNETESANVREIGELNGTNGNAGETSHPRQLPGKTRRKKKGRGRNGKKRRKRSVGLGTSRMTDPTGEVATLLNHSLWTSHTRTTENGATQKITRKTQVNADRSGDSDMFRCRCLLFLGIHILSLPFILHLSLLKCPSARLNNYMHIKTNRWTGGGTLKYAKYCGY